MSCIHKLSRLLPLLAAVASALLLPCTVSAQVVRGQVLAAEDGRPILGAFLVLIDSAGAQRAASLSDIDGRFRIQAPEPGTYRVRGELVGRPVDLSDAFTISVGEEKNIRLVSFSRPQLLSPVRVATASPCPADKDSERVAQLWDEISKALRVSEWSVRDERLVFDTETVRREWDSRYSRIEHAAGATHAGVKGRPFTTVSPEFLSEYGYVVARGFDNLYFAPDEKSLLHDSFLEQHCLALPNTRVASESSSLIGIAFSPTRDRLHPDISGTFWVSRDSLMLQAVDFRYTGLEHFAMHDSIGGRMEFDKLPTGEWFVKRWSIRMPVVTMCRTTGFLGLISPNFEPCLARIVETAGRVLAVRRQPMEWY